MYIFSSEIEVPAGVTLAGYRDRIYNSTAHSGTLEVHGVGSDTAAGWECCSVDSLYPGVLATRQYGAPVRRVVAASHTHYAPMLDTGKPGLGIYSEQIASCWIKTIEQSEKVKVSPDTCTIFRGQVDIPVYRRFDFPGTPLDHLLTRYAGFYPNEEHSVDKGVYLFVFSRDGTALFAFAYHACHPVTRHNESAVSSDYVRALRRGVQERFGTSHCMFFLGCAGDIRPNLARKRVDWLPRCRLNWRFKYPPTAGDEGVIDAQYRQAVLTSSQVKTFPISEDAFSLTTRQLNVDRAVPVEIPQLRISDQVTFSFLPFEVSHRYQLEMLADSGMQNKFIVSCAGDTRGYLPHPEQIRFGGYEVDGSRPSMGLDARLVVKGEDIW